MLELIISVYKYMFGDLNIQDVSCDSELERYSTWNWYDNKDQ